MRYSVIIPVYNRPDEVMNYCKVLPCNTLKISKSLL